MAEIRLEGFEEFADKLKTLPKEVLDEVDAETEDATRFWEQLAKNRAPRDKGKLVQNIRARRAAYLNHELVSLAFYSPYQEWGTGSRAVVPAELQAYAEQFRRGGKTRGIPPYNGGWFFPPKQEVERFWINNLKKVIGERL